MQVLVTGGTGTLGRAVVPVLRDGGHQVRVLSRRERPDVLTGDLLTGAGLDAALAGVEVVVHLATGRRDDEAARRLLTTAERAGVRHVVAASIVGVDRIPLPYYRRKLAAEQALAASPVPHTVLRATQFHDLVDRLFRTQRALPVLLAPPFALQPIDPRDVADRLADLVPGPPRGRAADIGGPHVLTGRALGTLWARARGSRRPVVPLPLPGRTVAAYRAGHNLVPGPGYGRRTFAQYLAESDPAGSAGTR